MVGMGKRPGYHDLFARIPDESWERFVKIVESLRPVRSVTQQVAWLIDAFNAGEITPEKVNFDATPKKLGRPRKPGP
jgi:hypothetical protein